MKSIIFGGGCFWGVQHYFKQVKGVVNTVVGYTDGHIEFPTYQQICTGTSGHNEVVKLEYDTNETNLTILLEHFFYIIDPTMLNQQGMDIGTQYRTGIYYYYTNEKSLINEYILGIKDNYQDPIVVEVKPAGEFWEAEEYHQDYLEINPYGYCHIGNKYCAAGKIDNLARNKYI